MHNRSFRRPYISLVLPFILAACAGGGHVAIPETIVPIPTLSALDINSSEVVGKTPDVKIQTFNAGTGKAGKLESWRLKERNFFNDLVDKDNIVYQAPDGKLYKFNTYTDPILPDSFHPNQALKNKQDTQQTDNGGKLFACCVNFGTGFAASKVGDDLRYGAWISKDGKADLFVGGILADPTQMQGASANNGQATGKATYEIWALRVKNGEVVSSSYDFNSKENPIRSRVTVNFNTGKLGGKIIGNSDFGADIDFKDVNVKGNRFSGSAESDGKAGQVDGGFFGKAGYYSPAGDKIGGKITFDADRNLDSVFGGSINAGYNRNANDKSQDLTPLH